MARERAGSAAVKEKVKKYRRRKERERKGRGEGWGEVEGERESRLAGCAIKFLTGLLGGRSKRETGGRRGIFILFYSFFHLNLDLNSEL